MDMHNAHAIMFLQLQSDLKVWYVWIVGGNKQSRAKQDLEQHNNKTNNKLIK